MKKKTEYYFGDLLVVAIVFWVLIMVILQPIHAAERNAEGQQLELQI
jgi:hypothetical protein